MKRASTSRDAAGLRAVILAGGKGTRLQPFTASFPKPLVPLGDKPVLEILIRRLLAHGINDVTLTLGHLAELIKAYFDHRQSLRQQLKLRYVHEEEPTGTAGSLALVPGLKRTFLAMNGDLLTNLDFHALVRFHRQQDAVLTIATHTRHVKVDLGVITLDRQHRIIAYHEKPESTYHVSMGVYVYEPRALRHIEHGRHLDFPALVQRLLDHGERVCAYTTDCLWLDIGRPDDYARAQELVAKHGDSLDVL
ncbi:MAG: NTP transferase domain-containing protein [Verrucomicrobia bacterium]|nr:NTP transferase domain-containing protein [Verrucomicrobiota bacterium]